MYSKITIARKYLHYWLTSSNGKGHGVHSPFVFDFITKVLNDKKKHPVFHQIELVRLQLLKNKEFIEVEDFGAGSALVKTNLRRVDKMAMSSLKKKKYAQLLFKITSYYQPKTIVELGTSFGITTSYLAAANPSSKIYTLEGDRNISIIALKNFKKLSMENIELIPGAFSKTLPLLLMQQQKFDLIFIDGNHKEEPTIDYFNQFLKHLNENTMMIFDDIHWSREMENAWEFIKNHQSVTLSVDLFFFGIVCFKKDFKEKQHFKIRF